MAQARRAVRHRRRRLHLLNLAKGHRDNLDPARSVAPPPRPRGCLRHLLRLRLLLPTTSEYGHTESTEQAADTSGRISPDVRNRAIVFAVLAFLIMLSEGVANDWSALHAVEHLGTSAGVGGFAYATFAISMTVGRLTVDKVAHRFGPAFVVRYGSLLAMAGIPLVMVSLWLPLTLPG